MQKCNDCKRRHPTVTCNTNRRSFESRYAAAVELEFSGEIWFWKGPAPWHFVTVPADLCLTLERVSGAVTYGWGMIPVTARIGGTRWTTSLWPKDGRYIVPLKTDVRRREKLELGQTVAISLDIDL